MTEADSGYIFGIGGSKAGFDQEKADSVLNTGEPNTTDYTTTQDEFEAFQNKGVNDTNNILRERIKNLQMSPYERDQTRMQKWADKGATSDDFLEKIKAEADKAEEVKTTVSDEEKEQVKIEELKEIQRLKSHSLPKNFGQDNRIIPERKPRPGYELLFSGGEKIINHIKQMFSEPTSKQAINIGKASAGLLNKSAYDAIEIAGSPYSVTKLFTDYMLTGAPQGSMFTTLASDAKEQAIELLNNAGVKDPTKQEIIMIGSDLLIPGGVIKTGMNSGRKATSSAVKKVLSNYGDLAKHRVSKELRVKNLKKGSETLSKNKKINAKEKARIFDQTPVVENAKNDIYIVEEGITRLTKNKSTANALRYRELQKEAKEAGMTLKKYVKHNLELARSRL